MNGLYTQEQSVKSYCTFSYQTKQKIKETICKLIRLLFVRFKHHIIDTDHIAYQFQKKKLKEEKRRWKAMYSHEPVKFKVQRNAYMQLFRFYYCGGLVTHSFLCVGECLLSPPFVSDHQLCLCIALLGIKVFKCVLCLKNLCVLGGDCYPEKKCTLQLSFSFML